MDTAHTFTDSAESFYEYLISACEHDSSLCNYVSTIYCPCGQHRYFPLELNLCKIHTLTVLQNFLKTYCIIDKLPPVDMFKLLRPYAKYYYQFLKRQEVAIVHIPQLSYQITQQQTIYPIYEVANDVADDIDSSVEGSMKRKILDSATDIQPIKIRVGEPVEQSLQQHPSHSCIDNVDDDYLDYLYY